MMLEPVLRYLGDDRWVLEEDYYGIPKGTITDLASIPRILWWLIAPFELGCGPALLHDHAYRNGGWGWMPRAWADREFLDHMKDCGVPVWRRYPAYLAVRLFGGPHWVPPIPS